MTAPELALLEEKYGKLIRYAVNYIHGDKSQSSEDYEQDIKILIIENVSKYLKRLKLNSFQELVDQYDHYIKQWIWTFRYGKGSENTRHKIERNGLSIDSILEVDIRRTDHSELFIDLSLSSSTGTMVTDEIRNKTKIESTVIDDLYLKEIEEKSDTMRNKITLAIMKDPEVYKNNGKLNILALSKAIKMPVNKVKSVLWEMEKELK